MKPPAALKRTPFTWTPRSNHGDGPVDAGPAVADKGFWLSTSTETRTAKADTAHKAGELMVWPECAAQLGDKVTIAGVDYTVLGVDATDSAGVVMYRWLELG